MRNLSFVIAFALAQISLASAQDKSIVVASTTSTQDSGLFGHILPLLLALWTGQRQGDLLRLPWSAYDGTHIRLRQSKTGKPVTIPVGAPLKAALDAATKHGPLILTNSLRRPWRSHSFQVAWAKAAAKAGIVGVTFHDLRGTAVTRLAIVGCTEAEIATITGHSLRDVRSILDANYLHRDPMLAENAIRKLERGASR